VDPAPTPWQGFGYVRPMLKQASFMLYWVYIIKVGNKVSIAVLFVLQIYLGEAN